MSSTNHNDNYKTVIVELAVYVDEDNYYHKGLSAEGIVEKELSAVENDTGIYLERIIPEEKKPRTISIKSGKQLLTED